MNQMTRVVVVDDSRFVTSAIARNLASDSGIEVVGIAHNGIEAIKKICNLRPDVVTLDIVMPQMDGLTTLKHIMSECPTAVVMLSVLTMDGAEATIKALELGAVDFFLKSSNASLLHNTDTTNALVDKVKLAARSNILKTGVITNRKSLAQQKLIAYRRSRAAPVKVVVIGSSTGGPRSLLQIIPEFPADLPAAILIVQHMPPLFTRSLAQSLHEASQIEVREAKSGDNIIAGRALIAPGGYHMVAGRGHRIYLNQGPSACGVRPSVDVTMKSVVRVYGSSSLGVVLTGMGRDGTQGAAFIKAAGGKVFVEDESTCAVYGMPLSIINAGYADRAIPANEIASAIDEICSLKNGR